MCWLNDKFRHYFILRRRDALVLDQWSESSRGKIPKSYYYISGELIMCHHPSTAQCSAINGKCVRLTGGGWNTKTWLQCLAVQFKLLSGGPFPISVLKIFDIMSLKANIYLQGECGRYRRPCNSSLSANNFLKAKLIWMSLSQAPLEIVG